ncbi:fumarylacetoacetate hydrolase family protein [Microbacterium sp. RD1]|uniref:fumarylacetoacetate hydrolase family protein n=1 Tax=Microbacterium sp. RD1 TaxID=3457313 RepID=UPI003FA5E4A6
MTGSYPWRLVTVEIDGERAAAIEADGRVHRPPVLGGYRGAVEALRDWDAVARGLRTWAPGDADEVVDATVHHVVPLAYPAKVLCSGPNFTDHLAEMGESGLGEDWTAYFFLKPPTTALIADGDAVWIDDPDRARVDWEGELGVVIGTGGRDIPAERALAVVAGYVVGNDISLRGPHRRSTPAAPFQWDWLASKGADASLPISGMVPAWAVPDPQRLRIRTLVNGRVMQDGTTADMVLDVATLVAHASRLVTLEPGDLILTGTPAGVGAGRGVFLQPDDVVEVEIPGVGSIRNPVRRRTPTEQRSPQ